VSDQLSPDLLLQYIYYTNCAVYRSSGYTVYIVGVPVEGANWSVVLGVIIKFDDRSDFILFIRTGLNFV